LTCLKGVRRERVNPALNPLALKVIFLCNVQYNAQKEKCHINISNVMQSPFKFQSSAAYYRHLVLVPRTNCKLLVGNDG
jgi:hypothetical protein